MQKPAARAPQPRTATAAHQRSATSHRLCSAMSHGLRSATSHRLCYCPRSSCSPCAAHRIRKAPGSATMKEPRRAGGCSAPHVPSRMKAISPSTTALQAGEAEVEAATSACKLEAWTRSATWETEQAQRCVAGKRNASAFTSFSGPMAAAQALPPPHLFSRTTKSAFASPMWVTMIDTGMSR